MKRAVIVALVVSLTMTVCSDLCAQRRRLFRFRRQPRPSSQQAEAKRPLPPPLPSAAYGTPTPAEPQPAGEASPGKAPLPVEQRVPLVYPLNQITPPLFSELWYNSHPQAWHSVPPLADVFAVTDLSALALWLGLPELLGKPDKEQPPPPAGPQPTGPLLVAPKMEPARKAQQWMALGVFALRQEGQGAATRIVQLATAPDGTIRGNHYDLVTHAVQPIHGQVQRDGLRLHWSIGPEGSVTFEAPVAAITRPAARWLARYPDGQTGWWTLSRLRP